MVRGERGDWWSVPWYVKAARWVWCMAPVPLATSWGLLHWLILGLPLDDEERQIHGTRWGVVCFAWRCRVSVAEMRMGQWVSIDMLMGDLPYVDDGTFDCARPVVDDDQGWNHRRQPERDIEGTLEGWFIERDDDE